MNESKSLYREALGKFSTGVCVVSTVLDNGLSVGMTINSFSSVSLEPKYILWSIKHNTATYEMFSKADEVVISVLRTSQADVSSKYAKFGDHVMDPRDIARTHSNLPYVKNALAYFECIKWTTVSAGDHDVLISEVSDFNVAEDGEPLVFYNGKYREIQEIA